jgi:hypothetical protein
MIRQCFMCLQVYGVKPPLEDHRVSHGLCDACYPKLLKEAGLPEEPEPSECYHGE